MRKDVVPGIRRRIAGESRRRRVAGAVAAIVAVAVVLGVLVSAGVPGSSRGATAKHTGSGSATVQRRDLIATDTVAGTLSYAKPQTVFNRVSGTITALPTVGAVVRPGGTLYRVDGAPVVLFDGPVPAYRTLTSGVSDGPDVQELKQNLVNLGFDPSHQITINQTFDAATVTAIDAWQAALGQTQTGTVTLGQVVFLPGPQRITTVDAVLGGTGGSSSGSGSASSSSTTGASAAASGTTGSSTSYSPVPHTEFVSFTTTPAPSAAPSTTAPRTTAAASAAPSSSTEAASKGPCPTGQSDPAKTTPPTDSGPASGCPKPSSPTAQQLLAQLVAELKKLSSSSQPGSSGRSSGSGSASSPAGASGSSGGRSSGGGGGGAAPSSTPSSGGGTSSGGSSSAGTAASGSGSATAILQTTSTQVIVSVALDATKQSEAVVGEPVTVQLPDGSTADGKVTAVSPVAQSTSSSSSSSSTAGGGGGGSTTPSATIPVTVTLSGHQPTGGLDQAAVSVNFQQQVERNVLSVPVTALLATAGGGMPSKRPMRPTA